MNKIMKKPVSKASAVRDGNGNLQTKPVDIANTFQDYLESTLQGGEPVNIKWVESAWAETKRSCGRFWYCTPKTGQEGPKIDIGDEQFEQQFERVTKPSVDPDGPRVDIGNGQSRLDILEQVWITPESVAAEIKKAKKDAAGGPDGLPMSVLSEAVQILCEPLAMLYNMVQQSGNIPKAWKMTRVVMLHKKKSQDDVKNFRPLSMSDHIGKVWERLINTAIKYHLEKHGLLDPHQHGFRGNMGTQTNLLEMWDEVITRLENDMSARLGVNPEVWS